MTSEKQSQNGTSAPPDPAPERPPVDGETAISGSRFSRQTQAVAAGTVFSRVLGVIREQVIAYYFGAGAFTDAFVAAFRISNLLRDFFAEGAFSAAFVPTFSTVLKRDGTQAAFALLSRILTVFALFLSCICILGIVFTPQIAWVFSGGLEASPGKIELLIRMARIMFPFLLLVSLAAALMGALNSLGHFGVPALAPAGFNLGMIAAAVLASRFFDPPILALAFGVLAGGVLQWGIQATALTRMGFRHRFMPGWRDPDVRRVARLMLPAAVGTAAVQINILAITRFAWSLGDGPVTYLNFAFRVLFVPLGVFAVAAATVGLPRLSERAAAGDTEGTFRIFRQAFQTVLYLVTPAAMAFVLLGHPICTALYERGAFDAMAGNHTARALALYAVGLPAMAAVRVTAPLFYAHSDTRTPTICGVSSVAANLILMTILKNQMGYAGLALSVALSAVLQIGLLLLLARRRFGNLRLAGLGGHFLAFCAVGWLAVRIGVLFMASPVAGNLPKSSVSAVVAAVGLAAVVYILVCRLLGYRQMGSANIRRRAGSVS